MVLSFLTGALTTTLGAQVSPDTSATTWPLSPGSKVRVLAAVLGDQKVTGTAANVTADSLYFRSAMQTGVVPIGTSDIAKLEVAHGTHTRIIKGAFIGVLIGGGGGALVGLATHKEQKPCAFCLEFGPGFDAAVAGLVGGIVGTAVGAIVGGAHRTDTWVPVALPRRP